MNTMVTFIAGLFIGSFVTMLSLAVTGANREDDDDIR